MANKMFLLRQRTASLQTRHLTTIASGVVKPSRIGLQNNLSSDQILVRQTFRHLQAENVFKSLKLISTLSGNRIPNERNLKFPSEDVKKLGDKSQSNWLPNYNQRERLLEGLLGFRRPGVQTSSRLGPLSYNTRGFHLAPASYCQIPDVFEDKPFIARAEGATYITDLCKESQDRLRDVAHAAIRRMLNNKRIDFVEHPPKKHPDRGLFKSSLEVQVEKDIAHKRNIGRVPALLRYLIMEIVQRDLDTVGIFRIPGNATNVKTIKADLEKHFYASGPVDRSKYDIHTFASLLKEYLRDQPQRLVSTDRIEVYPAIEDLKFKRYQYSFMQYLYCGMTEEHRETLEYLFNFLDSVAKRSHVNQMSADNIAVCLAPNLFRIGDVPPQQLAARFTVNAKVMKAWMYYYQDLPILSGSLMREVRQSFVANPPKIKFDSKLFPVPPSAPPVPTNLAAVTDVNTTVYSPYDATNSHPVKINQHTTAHHVVCQLLGIPYDPFDMVPTSLSSEESPPLDPTVLHDQEPVSTLEVEKAFHRLYEVGGNIGERRISPSALLLETYRDNPEAVWILKPYGKPPINVSK